MKKIIFPLSVLILSACSSDVKPVLGNDQNSANEEVIANNTQEVQVSNVYSDDSTKVGFGAFKTTEKKEVKGWFTDFSIVGVNQQAESIDSIFSSASIVITVNSLETYDEGRNERLLIEFFGKTSSAKMIMGKVNSFNTEANKVNLSLDFNGISKQLDFDYKLNGDSLNLTGSLNLADFNALPALKSLNKACEVLHKGDDGVSKTWEDVNIYISTVLNRKQ